MRTMRELFEAVSKKVGPDKYEFQGKKGRWRTVNGSDIFFPDDKSGPMGMPRKMASAQAEGFTKGEESTFLKTVISEVPKYARSPGGLDLTGISFKISHEYKYPAIRVGIDGDSENYAVVGIRPVGDKDVEVTVSFRDGRPVAKTKLSGKQSTPQRVAELAIQGLQKTGLLDMGYEE